LLLWLVVGATSIAKDSDQPLRGKSVLVVEDRLSIANLLAEILSLHGHIVDTVLNGSMALRQLRERTYDLIMSDLQMPVLDGLGLYRELERSRPDLLGRIVFVTGNADEPAWQTFLSDTGAPCISKPFTIDEVHRVTQQLLRAVPDHLIHRSP
jgi:CheY-like chemotaxis protein